MHFGRIIGEPAEQPRGPATNVGMMGLLAIAAARQAATPTSAAQRRLPAARRPLDAAFARPIALALAEWAA